MTVIDDGHAVAQPFGFFHVVRREENRSTFGAESRHHVPELEAALRIETRGWLVEKENVRIADERTRGCHPLFLTAGQLAHACVAFLIERKIVQQRVRIRARLVKRAEEMNRLVDGELFAELRLLQRDADALAQLAFILAPGEAEDFDFAGIGDGEAFEDFDGGGLASAVRTEKAEALTILDAQLESVDRFHVGVILFQSATNDCFGGH